MQKPSQEFKTTFTRQDIHQQVTDTIIQQLEKGTVPWHKPWKSNQSLPFGLPKNSITGNTYRGINVLLLWVSAQNNQFQTHEWASFKQWQDRKEFVRKGEKGTMVVYYDTFEKETDGELRKIAFMKSSFVFNRCQLSSYQQTEIGELPETDLVASIKQVDQFVTNTKAVINHHTGEAYYSPVEDKISMPYREFFLETESCTATEGYYSTLLHELTHWTGHEKRLDRAKHKKFGDSNYATEELVAELGAAFLCAKFDIALLEKGDHASYIASWIKVLKENKQCIFIASSAASQAVDCLQSFQPK